MDLPVSSFRASLSKTGRACQVCQLATPFLIRHTRVAHHGRRPFVPPLHRVYHCGKAETDRCVRLLVNQARAMRVAEIMNDYRNIHAFLAAIRASPTAEEYNEEGYLVLRRCVAEAQALLAQPFQALNTGRGDEEHDKMHLRRYCYLDRPPLNHSADHAD